MQLFAGQTFFAGSLVVLGLAVALKTILFIFFERRLPWLLAAVFIVLGNVLSTFIGIFLTVAASSPMLLLVILPIVFAISIGPARRLHRFQPWGLFGGVSPRVIAGLVTLLYFSTFFLFAASQGVLAEEGGSAGYWGLKLAYVYAGLAVSLFLTAAWEEAVVGFLARRRVERPFFLPAVLRANLYTILVVFAYATIEVVPRRLAAPNFLIGLLTVPW